MPDWHTGAWLHNGIADVVDEGGALRRVPHAPYVVELQDVVDAAHRLHQRPDSDWS